jgi:hypothetical protein
MANGIRWGFLAALAVGFVVFLSMILTVFEFSGASFYLSLLFFVGMMVFASIAMGGSYRGKRWGWLMLMFVCLITLLFSYVVYLAKGATELMTSMVAATIVLFVVSIVNVAVSEKPRAARPRVQTYQSMEKVEPYYEAHAAAKAAPRKKAQGKFVASKMASTYHTARCEWVPNIKRRNRIWFGSEASAKRAKFKPHECVK